MDSKFIVVLSVRDVPEGETYVQLYEMDSSAEYAHDPESALRAAAKVFLGTPDGQFSVEQAGGHWNWGNLMCDIPPKILKDFGLKPIHKPLHLVEVDHNEVLCETKKPVSKGIVLETDPPR